MTIPNFKDPSIFELAPDIVMCKTAKGYQTHELMSVYVRDVLARYCRRVWDEMDDQTLTIFLIMDICGCHRTETLSDVYASLKIRIIWLPLHFSHFLPP
jgi:hypothetical protein